MSDDEPEMMTISYEVTVEDAENLRQRIYNTRAIKAHQLALDKALDARKSRYERWRDRVGTDMSSGEILALYEHLTQRCGYQYTSAALMAAAPQLLERVIAKAKENIAAERPVLMGDEEAIRAAVPNDVADEVLGG